MRKKILGALAVVAIAAVATFNMNINNNDELSAISLANVEALAMNEGGAPCAGGCSQIAWGTKQIMRCDCSTTGFFSSCERWQCN
ncbi:NVEALA domain-containing protein [Sphingobacterium sp. UT-1RO-CII-1]|uniref:NVEALA domain-containing protein n=1 Tax=Sphingobacterium sp. UT-1RO-CII-1 TaxID=2995225 RepID=UPI00227D2F0A|nr:NVEALA domain-containing protein [Sphingobacterium sp. UT-1RO-CII-1]MCY4778304.1 NVEALA domain-containing protein [Sphingobacterium sp. UT-1RO-CII-1]